jgi:uncharacterized membrane protein
MYYRQSLHMRKNLSFLFACATLLAVLCYSCSKSSNDEEPPPPGGACSGTPGPLFLAVKQVLQTNCVSCHNNSIANGGMNWTVDCNIVANSARIKARAVDAHGTANQMPPPPNAGLSAADRQRITDWIAAGGRLTN